MRLYCALLIVWLLDIVSPVLNPGLAGAVAPAQYIVLALFALTHGEVKFGWRPMLGFAAIVILVTNIFENLSINTGFPFGWFAHQSVLGPKIFDVPMLVGVGYVAIGYVSMAVAEAILGHQHFRHRAARAGAVAAVSAFIAAGWDAAIDPIGATVGKSWLFRDGGGYFGVPLTNTLGWLIAVGSAIFLAYLVLDRHAKNAAGGQNLVWRALPPLVLVVQVVVLAVGWRFSPGGEVYDAAKQTWSLTALLETSALVSIVTCGAFGVIGLLRAFEPPLVTGCAPSNTNSFVQ